jgi:hypothetical protein
MEGTKEVMKSNPYAPPSAHVEDVDTTRDQDRRVAYFPVSPFKLVTLSICTLGLYQIHWFYKNRAFIKAQEKSGILPVMRAIFGVFMDGRLDSSDAFIHRGGPSIRLHVSAPASTVPAPLQEAQTPDPPAMSEAGTGSNRCRPSTHSTNIAAGRTHTPPCDNDR